MWTGRFKMLLTPLTKWSAIWIVNVSSVSSVLLKISKRQNAAFQSHIQSHCNCLLQKCALQSAADCWLYSMCGTKFCSLTLTFHLSRSGGMGFFFILGECKIVLLPSWKLLEWREMHIKHRETLTEQRVVSQPYRWIITVFFSFPDNQVARGKVL